MSDPRKVQPPGSAQDFHTGQAMKNPPSFEAGCSGAAVIDAASAAASGAFVLQIRSLRSGFAGRLCGNVEHPASGRASAFASIGELASFIDRTLKSPGAGAGDQRPLLARESAKPVGRRAQ